MHGETVKYNVESLYYKLLIVKCLPSGLVPRICYFF